MKALLNEEIRIINVPKLPELTASKLINEAYTDKLVKNYLPDMKDNRAINRDFLFNVRQT